MPARKRLLIFLASISVIVLSMAAILEPPKEASVFSYGSPPITVLDEETLLPIENCKIRVAGCDDEIYTDCLGQAFLPQKRITAAVFCEGYAPALLLFTDYSEGGSILLKKGTELDIKLDKGYAEKLFSSLSSHSQ